jgi:hypothetical protein
MVTVGLVVVGSIVVIVPLLASLAFDAVSLLALVFDPATCISVADNIAQVFVVPISVVLLSGSDATGRVPAQTLVVVRVLTPPSVSTTRSQVNHHSCVQHRLEALDPHVDLLIVFRQQGYELVNDHPRSLGIVYRHVVNLFSLVLDPAEFLADQL